MNWLDERVALLYGGLGSEAAVSRDGRAELVAAMRTRGIQPIELDVQANWVEQLIQLAPTRVFNLVHGRLGEDGVLQGVLCALNIPFTGSGLSASALSLDKPRTKQIWESLGLPTAPMVVVTEVGQAQICIKRLGADLFAKPAHEGSSIGAHQVSGLEELKIALSESLRHDTRVLVEPRLPGPEYTVGIIKGLALPVICIKPNSDFYDYTAKYQSNTTEYEIPSGLHPKFEAEVQKMALEAFDALGCRTWGRIDFMADGNGQMMLMECNTVPGMTHHSLVPKAARAAGMDLSMLVEQILLDAAVSP
ncbi:D-alanine--D-alanine ligase [Litorivicinus sp.]|nr:D-alanine--D-alanine ligase [Litorivicinus sp.]MDB9861917.1 D-alanine--D-alanine ligase [Litorivicinus sp.]MDC1208776.1 D-alanine--D-alanine ligase [Litorivicinus sp.]MDC1240628.1 D-alanine--D-alanine ligase [Litorivicinus sp.]MDC1466317.1 D-alanine--D-alanine ligase [Litorivicinus sp.]